VSRPLLEHRLIFVTGKGGVGRSTVAGALGLATAERGMRTIVAELTGERRLARAFGIDNGRSFTEIELAPGLFTISISPERAMDEYLRVKVPGPLGHLLAQSHLFHHFAMATPGMRELLCLGKVWELAQTHRRSRGGEPYDLVIVDAPATGHGVGALKTPRTFSEIARVGPIAHQGQTIARTIADAEFTAIVAVCTPEEMPVTETLELHGALSAEHLELDAVVLNARYPDRFAQAEMAVLQRALSDADDGRSDGGGSSAGGRLAARGTAGIQGAIRSALSEHQRAATQATQERRLRAEFDGPVMTLPFVFAPAIGSEQLRMLAAWLQEGL
jgi:anion-transporting  ArsA/GET3 family ATPase